MKPLIIAVDIVKFSLNSRVELKAVMEDFFGEMYRLKEDDLSPHVLPTGDGAILVWQWEQDAPFKPEDLLIPQKIIAEVLGTLKKWSHRNKHPKVRLGIHCDPDIEHIRVADKPSFFGHGISRCVRYETAADSNQALLSQVAQEYLQVPDLTSGLELGRVFTFFDKHGKKYDAYPVGLKSDTHWSLRTPASSQESAVRAELRKKEEPLNNNFLQVASSATIVAMTYKTLGAALANKKSFLALTELREAEICVFSLPVLRHNHPTLKDNFHALEQEWVNGVCQAIESLLNKKRCPKLEQLDLTVLSAAPVLTATVTFSTNEARGRESILRYHPILDGSEPEDIPTLILNKSGEDSSPLFDAFYSMIKNVPKNPPRLRFPLRRGKHTQTNILGFVHRVKTVCNNSMYEPHDRLFDVKWQNADAQSITIESLMPETVFSRLAGHRKTNDLQVTWDQSASHEVILSSRSSASGAMTQVTGKHLMAFFVLLTWDSKVVLVNKSKPGWSHDVPGGKVTVADRSAQDTVQREVFEELGLLLIEERLEGPVGALYDPRSAKEKGIPVIAQYFHYRLDKKEYKYLFGAAKATTKGESLVLYPLTQLMDEKNKNTDPLEAVCHASLAVIQSIVTELARK